MKKNILMMSLMACMSLSAAADDVKQTVTINGQTAGKSVVKITFSGDNAVLLFDDQTTETVDMEAVVIDFTNESTDISERMAVTTAAGLEGKSVYTMGGQYVGNSAARLQKGSYIIGGKKVIIK